MNSPHEPALGWGILATGRIAADFARDLREVPGARLTAVGSRDGERAAAFAQEYGDPDCRSHSSYDDLVADEGVDIVYVATPHALHREHALLALAAGKHVLCEKPLTVSRAEAEQLTHAAREAGRFLMEAMWTACHPVIRAVVEGVRSGRFGRPRQLHADLGWFVDLPVTDRLLDPALGGGALLDLGIYPLTVADLLLGPAEQARAVADVTESGIDLDVAIATRHPGGAVGALTASMGAHSPRSATLGTDTGRLDLPADFHHPPYAVWTPAGGEPERIDVAEPLLGIGLGNEAAEVGRCVRAGLLESPLVPHAQSLRLMALLDDIRRQIGVRYAADG